jgi:hypothetical protein
VSPYCANLSASKENENCHGLSVLELLILIVPVSQARYCSKSLDIFFNSVNNFLSFATSLTPIALPVGGHPAWTLPSNLYHCVLRYDNPLSTCACTAKLSLVRSSFLSNESHISTVVFWIETV